jgi:hypothetical protein
MTSEAGALLLGATDQQIGLIERFASCFSDHRVPDLVEHSVPRLVGQRVFGIALGYETLPRHNRWHSAGRGAAQHLRTTKFGPL